MPVIFIMIFSQFFMLMRKRYTEMKLKAMEGQHRIKLRAYVCNKTTHEEALARDLNTEGPQPRKESIFSEISSRLSQYKRRTTVKPPKLQAPKLTKKRSLPKPKFDFDSLPKPNLPSLPRLAKEKKPTISHCRLERKVAQQRSSVFTFDLTETHHHHPSYGEIA